jgi:predicted transcriptional regulator
MMVEKEGLNEWEAGQVAAFEILQKICQEHVEEMGRTPMCFFPPTDLNNGTWCQRGIALTDEAQSSHNPTLAVTACANLAITKMYQARETSHKYWHQNFNLCNIELKVTNHLWEASKNTTNQVMDYAIRQEWEMNHQYAVLWAQALAVEQQRAEAIERATDVEAARDEIAENFEYAEHTLQEEVDEANAVIANLQLQLDALQVAAPPEAPEDGEVMNEDLGIAMEFDDLDEEEEPEELELVPDDQTETDLDDDYPLDSGDE